MTARSDAIAKLNDPATNTLNLGEVALVLGVARTTVYHAAKRTNRVMDGVPVIRVGTRCLVSAYALRQALGLNDPKPTINTPVATEERDTAQAFHDWVDDFARLLEGREPKFEWPHMHDLEWGKLPAPLPTFVEWCGECGNRTPHQNRRGFQSNGTFYTKIVCMWCQWVQSDY